MKNMKLHPLILSLMLTLCGLISFPSWALTVTASVNKTKVSKDEVIQLRIVADEKLDGSKVSFDNLSDDFYTGRPNFSSSVNILNGSRTDSSVWTIAIAPQRIGKITIPSFDVDGVKTSPITLSVTIDEQTPTTDDMIEVRTQIGKQTLFPKESTLLDTRIIVKVDPRLLQNPEMVQPRADGVTLAPVGEPKQYQAVLDGMDVLIIDQQYRVTAQNAGAFTLHAPTLSGGVLYGNNRSGTTKILTLNPEAPTLALTVQPIPEHYQGVWLPTSALSLTQSWQRADGSLVSTPHTDMATGDALTRTITLQAMGLTANQLPNLALQNPDGFRVYPEKPTFVENSDGSVTMTTKQVLIAKKTGEYHLPELTINWWNTDTNQADQSVLTGLLVNVEQSDEAAALELNGGSPSSTVTVVQDSGFWPYLSGVLGVLWVISTLMWYRAHKRASLLGSGSLSSHSRDSLHEPNLLHKQQLIQAIKDKNAIKAQSAFHLWVKENPGLLAQDVENIQAYLTQMSRSVLVEENNTNCTNNDDTKAVLALIEGCRVSDKSSELAHL
ncbi:BatD family protein [Vibrio methylphosphonaticus]|uniref:BatD family protein n=1 Tax=Vibrio methylphosphonaticus TaxID=2946866 RepID=UPI00202AA60E|nr:BatD family protein [Vibrio methylphosphonaticus]MCL9773832.1 BatD family protein [Vibrio methylphosphonaticus]